ncbi:MAG: divergent PAP2 family protein [Alicyclobacillaceae bacterium]|nr:divergent PAP2 family protein [Alicyclobacillaceae bacterium]
MWVAPLVAMVVAQVLKPFIVMIRLRRWDWQRMKQSGGMPSAHSALVTALVTELWLREGGGNAALAVAVFMALVVMYDAAGVRWQTGRQAAVLNRLLHDLQGRGHLLLRQPTPSAPASGDSLLTASGASPSSPTASLSSPVAAPTAARPSSPGKPSLHSAQMLPFNVAKAPWWLMDWPVLNEHVGHKPTEVMGGVIVGVLVALSLH